MKIMYNYESHENKVNREVNSIVNGIFQKQSKRISLSKKEYWEIDVYEIEKQVKKHLGIDIEIIPDNEMCNGYTPITYAKKFNHSKDIEKYKNGDQWAMNLCHWLEHLIFLNVIPEGDFLVDHSW